MYTQCNYRGIDTIHFPRTMFLMSREAREGEQIELEIYKDKNTRFSFCSVAFLNKNVNFPSLLSSCIQNLSKNNVYYG